MTFAGLAGAQQNPTRLKTFLADLETFSARFEQTLYNAAGEELEASEGVVYLEQPGKFRWEYREPYDQILISNGSTLWIHDKDLEQVTINNIDVTAAGSPASILTGEVDADKNYQVRELDIAGRLSWVELVPREADAQFNTVRLGFDGRELSEMILFDNFNQKTLVRFEDVRRNPDLEDSLFEFTIPEGVDVIDSRE